MRSTRRPTTPLDGPALERLALRYVERFATTRGRLRDYLQRKIRERGWAGDAAADPEGVAERMAELGYVNDRLYAESKAGAMARRGLGARRVSQALHHAGIEKEDAAAVAPMVESETATSAIAFARRKRIGPFARESSDRPAQEKQLAAMLRAGHSLELARRLVRMEPGEDTEHLLDLYS
jgi:regulatory protein